MPMPRRDDRNRADIEARALEAHLERQPVNPAVLARPAQGSRTAEPRVDDRPHQLGQHQAADGAEEGHVGDGDDQVELAEPAEAVEHPDADQRADDAGQHQHDGELHVDHPPAPVAERPRGRRGDDLGRHRRDRDHRRNAREDEERSEQEPAAHSEQAGQEADGGAHAEDDEHVDRQFGYGQVDLHGGTGCRRRARRNMAGHAKIDKAPPPRTCQRAPRAMMNTAFPSRVSRSGRRAR